MDRLLTSELIAWKTLKQRKPVLLDGARQVGKSYLIEKCFGSTHFKRVIILNFGILHIGVYTLSIYAAIFQNLTLVRSAHPTR